MRAVREYLLNLWTRLTDASPDFIKCTFPLVRPLAHSYQKATKQLFQSFAVMSVCWGANDFGKGQ
jgi:hypothetical protein